MHSIVASITVRPWGQGDASEHGGDPEKVGAWPDTNLSRNRTAEMTPGSSSTRGTQSTRFQKRRYWQDA